jgi:hypothetical protein
MVYWRRCKLWFKGSYVLSSIFSTTQPVSFSFLIAVCTPLSSPLVNASAYELNVGKI